MKKWWKGLKILSRVLIIDAVVLLLYTIFAAWVFLRYGEEMTTLTSCVFKAGGAEGLFSMAIKCTNIIADKKTAAPECPDKPPEHKNLEDAG